MIIIMRQFARHFARHKYKYISVMPFILFGIVYGSLLMTNRDGADAATALCYGQPGTHTAATPVSVYPGQTFKLTNITGYANTNIATVNSTAITFSVSGATPTSATENWNGGPVHGDYTSTYPDLTLKTTASAGSKIVVSITSIAAQITVAGVNSTITCSVSNGQLTANQPGQSLVLATVNVVAPPKVVPKTSTPKSTTVSSPKTSTSTMTNTLATKPTAKTPPTSTTQAVSLTASVSVLVKDYKGSAISGSRIILDSQPAVLTDSSGRAVISQVGVGNHSLSITTQGKTITQNLNIDPTEAGKVLGIAVQMPAPSHKKLFLMLSILITLIAALIGIIALIVKLKRARKFKPTSEAFNADPVSRPEPANQVSPQVIVPNPASDSDKTDSSHYL